MQFLGRLKTEISALIQKERCRKLEQDPKK